MENKREQMNVTIKESLKIEVQKMALDRGVSMRVLVEEYLTAGLKKDEAAKAAAEKEPVEGPS
jgi:hypothetical protein